MKDNKEELSTEENEEEYYIEATDEVDMVVLVQHIADICFRNNDKNIDDLIKVLKNSGYGVDVIDN